MTVLKMTMICWSDWLTHDSGQHLSVHNDNYYTVLYCFDEKVLSLIMISIILTMKICWVRLTDRWYWPAEAAATSLQDWLNWTTHLPCFKRFIFLVLMIIFLTHLFHISLWTYIFIFIKSKIIFLCKTDLIEQLTCSPALFQTFNISIRNHIHVQLCFRNLNFYIVKPLNTSLVAWIWYLCLIW